jgi:hypothetical protein
MRQNSGAAAGVDDELVGAAGLAADAGPEAFCASAWGAAIMTASARAAQMDLRGDLNMALPRG